MVRQITSPSVDDQRQALVKFRKLLAHEDIHPYLNRIVDSGIVPTFVGLLRSGEPDLQARLSFYIGIVICKEDRV